MSFDEPIEVHELFFDSFVVGVLRDLIMMMVLMFVNCSLLLL